MTLYLNSKTLRSTEAISDRIWKVNDIDYLAVDETYRAIVTHNFERYRFAFDAFPEIVDAISLRIGKGKRSSVGKKYQRDDSFVIAKCSECLSILEGPARRYIALGRRSDACCRHTIGKRSAANLRFRIATNHRPRLSHYDCPP